MKIWVDLCFVTSGGSLIIINIIMKFKFKGQICLSIKKTGPHDITLQQRKTQPECMIKAAIFHLT